MTEPARSWIHLLLIDLLAGRVPKAAGRREEEWTRACAVASEHGMLGVLARAGRTGLLVPAEVDRRLQAAALRTAASHRKNLAAAREVLEVLDRRGCEAMVLKGPRLVERYYHDPTLRSYGDIDVYVRPERLEASLDALGAAGYELVDRNWRMLVEGHRGQLHL
ncbi:MAG: nucleotidyltransferase family protein, partial [Actinomycetota bacterium]